MRAVFRLCVALGSMSLAAATARAELACTFDQMQLNPDSVIDPCSQALDGGGLADADKAQDFYVRGRAYARTGRTSLAAQDFDVAVKFAPRRADIWVSRANAEGRLGRLDEEWNDLQRALTLNPKEARAWFAIGDMYQRAYAVNHRAGDLEQALSSFGRALDADPGEPYARLARSEIYADRHQFAEAMTDATALVNIPAAIINRLGYVGARGTLSDFHVVALNNRAAIYESVGNQAAADQDLADAIAEQPSASTYKHRAESLLRHAKSDQALTDIDEAVRLDAADGDVQYLRGLILIGLSRYAESLDAFDKAIAAHKAVQTCCEQFGMDYLMRARALRGLGKTDDAVASVTQAVYISPDVRRSTAQAMDLRGYWHDDVIAVEGAPFQAALRACMIDKDCN